MTLARRTVGDIARADLGDRAIVVVAPLAAEDEMSFYDLFL